MKDLYFSHDCNAFNDIKMMQMRGLYGMEGIGVYWTLVEMLRREEDADYSLAYSERALVRLQAVFQTSFKLTQYMEDCIDIGLFATDGESFWSESLRRRMKGIEEKKSSKVASAKKAASARWSEDDATAMRPQCDRNATACEDDATAMRPQCDRNATACEDDATAMRPQCESMPNKNKNKKKNEMGYQEEEEERAREPLTPIADSLSEHPATDDQVSALIEPDWKRVSEAYMRQLGKLPMGTAGEELVSFCEDLGADAVICAIERTNAAQPRSPYAYLKRLLNLLAENGVHSQLEAEAFFLDHDRREQQKERSPQQPREPTPQDRERDRMAKARWYG